VKLPESRAKPLEQEQKPIEISIDEAGRVFVDTDEVSDRDLPALLQARAAKAGRDGPPTVYLRADTALSYGKVMRVMGELNRAGLNKVSMVTTGETRR
jgi:biopolymer transport protein TolR